MQELMPPYLDTLIMKLTGLLRNGQKIVQEGALTAMASVADCAKSHFVNYYSQASCLPLAPFLLHKWLLQAHGETFCLSFAQHLRSTGGQCRAAF